jgi:predicted amidohydrolase
MWDGTEKMKLGVVQFQPEFGQIDTNIRKIGTLIEKAPDCDLLVLPELCSTGYQFVSKEETFSLSETSEGKLGSFLREMAVQKQTALTAGFAEKEGDRLFNSAMLVDNSGDVHIYRKAHLFYKENEFFEAGNIPFHPVTLKSGLKVGVMVCFDWIFPEVVRTYALNGADVIAHPANLVLPWCQKAMFARAVENRIPIITANRTGFEDRDGERLEFTGMSQVMGAEGTVLVSAGTNEEGVFVAEYDTDTASKQLNSYNHLLKNRRTDLYFN